MPRGHFCSVHVKSFCLNHHPIFECDALAEYKMSLYDFCLMRRMRSRYYRVACRFLIALGDFTFTQHEVVVTNTNCGWNDTFLALAGLILSTKPNLHDLRAGWLLNRGYLCGFISSSERNLSPVSRIWDFFFLCRTKKLVNITLFLFLTSHKHCWVVVGNE